MALDNSFKVKNGLTVNETISAGSCVEADAFKKHGGTSGQFLKADGSVDSSSYTTCIGTVVAGDLVGLDQSGCAGLNCTGDLTDAPENGNTYGRCDDTWVTLAGAQCVGDITGVTVGAGLSGGGSSGGVTVGIDSGVLAGLPTAGEKAALSGIDDFVCGPAIPTGQGNVGLCRTDGSIVCTFAVGLNSSSTPTFNTVTASSGGFVKSGGTSSQFLKADGSVDSSEYIDNGSNQSIAGNKTFDDEVTIADTLCVQGDANFDNGMTVASTATFTGNILSAGVNIDQLFGTGGGGGVSSVTGGDGITSSGGANPDIAVDSTVVRTTGTQTIGGCKNFTNTSVAFQDEICVRNAIRRCGDSNTAIVFSTDNINMCAGGVNMINLEEDPSAQDRVIINCSGVDLDLQIHDSSCGELFYTDASTARVGIGTCLPDSKLTVAGSISATENINAQGVITTGGTPVAEVGSWLHVGRSWAFSGLPYFHKTSGSTAVRYDGEFMANVQTSSASSQLAHALFGESFNDIAGYSGAGTDYSRAIGMSAKVGFGITGTQSANLVLGLGLPKTGGAYADADPISNHGFGVEVRRAAGSVYEWRVFGHDGTTFTASSWSSTGIIFTTDPRTLAIYSDGSGNVTAYTALYGSTDYTTITTTGGPTAASGTGTTTNHSGIRVSTNASGYVTGANAKARVIAVNFYSE